MLLSDNLGTLQGNNREVLHKLSVDLPKKCRAEPILNTPILMFNSGMVVAVNLHFDLPGFAWRSGITTCTRWLN